MAQSKLPAKCAECGALGPARKEAAKQGWIRGYGKKPHWYCPEHGKIWKDEEDKRLREQKPVKIPNSLARAMALGMKYGTP